MFKIQRENAPLYPVLRLPMTHNKIIHSHLRAHWIVVIDSHLQNSKGASPPEVAILLLNFRLQSEIIEGTNCDFIRIQ